MKLHINIPRGHYIGQVRKMGVQRWDTVTGRCSSAESAMSRAALKMQSQYRARVLFIDASGWYAPNLIMEAKRS